MKKILFILGMSCLLCGCSTKTVEVVKPVVIQPPHNLTEDCKMTPFTPLKTNAEILISFQTLYLDFKDCNVRMEALRKWYEEMEADTGIHNTK